MKARRYTKARSFKRPISVPQKDTNPELTQVGDRDLVAKVGLTSTPEIQALLSTSQLQMDQSSIVKMGILVRQLQLAEDFLSEGCAIAGILEAQGGASLLSSRTGDQAVVEESGMSALLDTAMGRVDRLIRLAVAQLSYLAASGRRASSECGQTRQMLSAALQERNQALMDVKSRDSVIEGLSAPIASCDYSSTPEVDASSRGEFTGQAFVQAGGISCAEDVAKARPEPAPVDASNETTKSEREVARLRENLRKAKEKFEGYKADATANAGILRLVYRHYGELASQHEKMLQEIAIARLSVDRVKSHLSYRLGNILVKNTNSIGGYLSVPIKLINEHKKFKSEKSRPSFGDKGVSAQTIPLDQQFLYLKSRSLNVLRYKFIAEHPVVIDVATPVFGKAVELQIVKRDGHYPFGKLRLANGQISDLTTAPIQVALRAGRDQVAVLPAVTGIFELEFRAVSGLPAIVIVRPADSVAAQMEKQDGSASIGKTVWSDLGSMETPKDAGMQDGPTRGSEVALPTPTPIRNAIILQAHTLIEQGHENLGIEFAELHARTEIRNAINLLKANTSLHSDGMWLEYVNNYLGSLGTAPIALEQGDYDRFARLTTAPLDFVEEGPKVTIIMPAFNSEGTILHAVKSILNQTWRNIELFIVDDCSSDSTWKIICGLARTDTRIKILRNRNNVGPYVSKNLAVTHSQGAYITGHDADDWAHPDRIRSQVTALLSSGGRFRANIAKMLRIRKSGKFSFVSKENSISPDGILREAAISCMFDRKFFVDHLGYWDCVRFGADSEMISRARKVLGDGFQKVNSLSMLCLDEEGSLTNDPTHGISRTGGVSPVRRVYKDQWTAWHAQMETSHSRIDFPYIERAFHAPDEAKVPLDHIRQNIAVNSTRC